MIRFIHDTAGHILTIWLDDPAKEAVSEESADEVVLMKDAGGRVIGVEILHYQPTNTDPQVFVETLGRGK